MTVIHIILMAPQYLYYNDVTYSVITKVNIRLGLRRTTMNQNQNQNQNQNNLYSTHVVVVQTKYDRTV